MGQVSQWRIFTLITEIARKDIRVATRTHCPYCAFQCGMLIDGLAEGATISGNSEFPVNKGALCIKGWTAASALNHPERLMSPLMRDVDGVLAPVSWDAAMTRIVSEFRRTQDDYGPDAVGVFGGGSLTNEKSYLMGKFARVALGTANIDYNGRFCMSSAAAASIKAFGIDRGLPFPVEDIAGTEAILLVGSNASETMPPIMQYFEGQRASGGRLIVADPRLTPTAQRADLHLRLTPGTDAALANGILHILVRDGLIDADYIESRTDGFPSVRGTVSTYWPERVERITGVSEADLAKAAHMLGEARTAMVLTARGAEQQAQGVNNTLSFINIALALGLVGKPNSGYGCLTGQGNGQGGREHGQKADQLPGYRKIDDPAAREHVAAVWGIDPETLPAPGKSAYELLDSLGQEDGVRSLLVLGSNVVVSAPNALHVESRLRLLDFLVVSDFFLSETAELADVVLPSAQWAEEEGTMTNLEGRVIRRRRAFQPPDGIRNDMQVLCELAERLGRGQYFRYENAEEVFEELGRASAGGPADYSGITYEKIEANDGVFWPCTNKSHPGTPRMFAQSFATPSGKATFNAVQHQQPADPPDSDFPLYLTTGRLLAQYQSGTQTRRVPELMGMAPEAAVEVHPTTARLYGLLHGGMARISTRRGDADFRVQVTANIREDTLFVPFHWGGMRAANRLTSAALDPTSRMPEFKVCGAKIAALKN